MSFVRSRRAFALVAAACAFALAFAAFSPSSTVASFVTLTVVDDPEADPIELSGLTFSEAEDVLGPLAGSTLSVDLPGQADQFLDAIAIDAGTSSITLTGAAGVMVLATWDGATPDITFAMSVDNRSLADLGLSGDLVDTPFARVVLLQSASGQPSSVATSALPAAATAFLDGLHPGAESGQLVISSGLDFAARLDLGALPGPLSAAFGTGDVLLSGSLGSNDFGVLSGSMPDTSSLSLSAVLPELGSVLPDWLSLTTPTLSVTYSEGAVVASLSLVAEADVDGTTLTFTVDAALDFDAATATLDAALVSPWVAPFGLNWLTLNSTTLGLAIDGAGSVDVSLTSSVSAGASTVDLALALAGGEATFTGHLDSLTSADLASLLGSSAGVVAPTGLPDLSLTDLTVFVDTATEAFSVSGDVAAFGVSGSVLVSALDRGDGREVLLGIGLDSTTLGDLPLGLTGAPGDIVLPDVGLAFVQAGSGTVEIARDDLTAPELAFFDGRFGLTAESDTLTLANGLNLEASLAAADLPDALLDALGLDGSGSLLLEGTLAIDSGAVTGATLSASLPGTPSIAGMPDWFQGDPGVPFQLDVAYADGVGSFGASAGFLVTADGVDQVPFEVALEVTTAGSVSISGASTAAWPTPFDQPWLTSLDVVSLNIELDAGGDASATLDSSFVIGGTTFTLDVGITGSSGAVGVAFNATASQITDEDLLALIAATGAPTDGLSLPDFTATDLVLSAGAGTSGFTFEVGGKVTLFDNVQLNLVLSLVADGAGGLRVIGGFQANDLSLSDIVPDTAGTFAGDLTLDAFALVVSLGGDAVASDDLSPVLRGFFDGIYGSSEYEVDLGSGITLIASTSVPEELETVADALGGLTVDRLLLTGSIGIPWGSGSTSSGLSLTASIPRLEFPSGGPDWFRYASLAFTVSATPAGFEVSLAGELGITITEDAGQTDLTFIVEGELKAGAAGLQFAFGGQLQADQPWEQPFGIEWLVINNLSLYLSFDATTQGFGLELGGDAVLGVEPDTKQLAVTVGLELNIATGIPTNFVFVASSTSNWGLQDLLGLYSLIEPEGGELLDGIPDIQLRPVDEDTPIQLKFALKNSPNVSAGFALRGSLWVELRLDQPLEQVAVLDVEVGTAGIFLEGASSIPILLGPVTLTNTEFDLDWAFQPSPDFAFFAAADLESELLGNTRLEVQVPFDLDFNDLLQDVLANLQNIEQIWADLRPLLDSDPAAAFTSDSIRDLYDAVGLQVPPWIDELMTVIDAIPQVEGVPTNPVALVNAVLGGFEISISGSPGYPTGGVPSGTCAPLATGPNGHCYVTPPSSGVEQGFRTVTVCDFALYEDGECWIVPPSITISTSLQTFCPTGFMEQGKCWLIPPSITTTVSKVQGCSDVLAILENGRCWTLPPSLTWTSFYAFGACVGIESGGTCYGVPPGPPVYASNSWPQQLCPGITIPYGGKCYETIPGPPALTYPSTPITGCVPPLIEAQGECWSPIPGPPLKSSAQPYQKQVCDLPGIVQNGKCWEFGKTPTAGLPVGGFEPGCPIWAPFYVEGECWTIPPTDDLQLVKFEGICHELNIACSLGGLIEDTIIAPIITEIRSDLNVFTLPADNAPPVANAGGPYSVPEGGSVSLSGSLSSDPEGGALTYAWDLDNDGQFDDASGVTATFSAAGIDGPASRTIGLRVTDTAGNTDIHRVAVTVTNVAPTLTVNGPAVVDEMETYTLTLSATDPGSETLSWSIDWGDGGTATVAGNSGTLTHQFTGNPLNPVITVTASDEDGDYAGGTIAVTVIAVSPTITADVTSPVTEGGVATLTGTIIEPGGDDALEFTVDWGDGNVSTYAVAAGTTSYVFSHRYLDDPSGLPDTYDIQVVAVNEDGLSDEASATVTVLNAAPTLELQGGEGDEGSSVTLQGLIRDAGPEDTFTLDVDWGDGTVESFALAADERTLGYTHVYADDGEYTVTVTVTDDDGGSAQETAVFDIANVAPEVAGLTASPTVIDEDQVITLSGSIVEPGADAVTLAVDWGDGTVESFDFEVGEDEFSLTHRYLDDRPGAEDLYPVLITATDDDGGETESTTSLGVANVTPSEVVLTLSEEAIDEADGITLSGEFVDPGTLDTFTVVIDWGDGTEATTLELEAGERSFDADHVYADDDPAGTSSDAYAIQVSVTDDDLGRGEAEAEVTVSNVAPSALTLEHESSIDEDGTLHLAGEFVDPGVDDTFTVTVDWGDGSEPTVLDLEAGERSFEASHQYLDDDPTATPSDVYTVTVTVEDDDLGVTQESSDFTVLNVAPVLAGTPLSATILSTETQTIEVTFTDAGTLDTHTAVIDWGNGLQETVVVAQLAGGGSLGGSLRYVDPGDYVITVTVTDDDGGVGVITLHLEVLGPQDLKEAAAALLAPHDGVRRVDQAIGSIEDSLADALWADVIRPDDKRGHSIFDRERQAARTLQDALDKDGSRLGAGGRAAVAEALDLLVTADWVIVRVGWVDAEALPDAIQTNRARQVERELDSAEDAYQAAQAAQAAGDHESAIQRYRETWQHLDRAFQHAGLR